jgi:pimeloyl-ACP methyl ester carboxylesterase
MAISEINATDTQAVAPIHLIVLIHGINTRAMWEGILKPILEDCGFKVATTSYGIFPVSLFLLPISWFRNKPITRILTDIRTAIRIHKPDLVSVIAHSFGTHVLAKIIEAQPELRWNRIIFCGSVVSENFPLHQFLDRFNYPLVNEVGTRDVWPAMAASVTWGYGSVGSHGFNKPPVETRWHRGFRHSDFLTAQFCQGYWVPFLRDGTLKRGDSPDSLPWWTRILTRLPLRWIIVAAFIAILAILSGLIWPPISHRDDWSFDNCRDFADEANRAFDVDKSNVSRAEGLIDCKNPMGYNLLGKERFYSHDYGTAERAFSDAVKVLPHSASTQRRYDWIDNLANTELETGHTKDAIRDFEYLLGIDHKDAVTWDLARAHLYAHDYKASLTLLGEVGVTFAGMTRPGKVEILQAAALVGDVSTANANTEDKNKQLMEAKGILCRGILRSEDFWRGVLSERTDYEHASFREEIRLLKEIGGGSIECPPPS